MKIKALLVPTGLALAALSFGVLKMTRIGRQDDGSYLVPTGQYLTPAGKHIEVNDRPLGMVLSPGGKTMAVVTGSNFSPRALHLIEVGAAAVSQSLPVGDSFVGVAFSPDGSRLYVGGGQSHEVKVFHKTGGQFAQETVWKMPGGAPSGLALSPDGRTLYVALNLKHVLAVVDTASGTTRQIAVGSYPYTVVATAERVYVSNWAGRRPLSADRTDGVFPVALDARGIPSSGTVSVIDAKTRQVLREVEGSASQWPGSPYGDRTALRGERQQRFRQRDRHAHRQRARHLKRAPHEESSAGKCAQCFGGKP